jgi:hypothetical protein
MGSSTKKIAKNVRIVQQHGAGIMLINAFFIFLRLYRNRHTASWGHYASLVPTTATYAICYFFLQAQAVQGDELFQKGLVEYCWDMLWVTMFVQVLACYTDWAWVLYSIVRAAARLACVARRSQAQRLRAQLTLRAPRTRALLPSPAADHRHVLRRLLRLDANRVSLDQQTGRCQRRRERRHVQEAREARAPDAPRKGQVSRGRVRRGRQCA